MIERTADKVHGATTKTQLTSAGILTAVVVGIKYRKEIANFLFPKREEQDDPYQQSSCKAHDAGLSNSQHFSLKKHPQGFGGMVKLADLSVDDVLLLPVPHLSEWLPEENQKCLNVRSIDTNTPDSREASNPVSPVSRKCTYNKIMSDRDVILGDIRRHPGQARSSRAYLRAGPRRELFFDPSEVIAAVVTCGGLCPGLNNVIRDITLSLWNLYGVRKIYGIRGGFAGFYNWTKPDQRSAPLMLTPQSVSGIHHWGGTILGSDRGGFDVEKIFQFLSVKKVNQLYVIGGDGTHRAAFKLSEESRCRGLMLSVAGVPKTIDNDVDLLDRSFGFNTSVEEAQRAIRSAKTEACCVPNGIGIVKLMGRSAGFIAAHATLSSGDVNLCCVPEVPIVLFGKVGCLPHLKQALQRKGHAVMVVAEGAGEELLGESAEVDAGGNKKLPAIGLFMKDQILKYFESQNMKTSVKYIDPSYMIRSVPANAADSLYCMLLAQNAVHGAMSGYTAFTVGLCGNRVVYLPMEAITRNSPRCMDPFGRTWERVICLTRQPNTAIEVKSVGAIKSDPPI